MCPHNLTAAAVVDPVVTSCECDPPRTARLGDAWTCPGCGRRWRADDEDEAAGYIWSPLPRP